MKLLLLMTVAAQFAFELDGAPSGVATKRGAMAFHYARPLTPAELEWYGRFELLVTHDPLPRVQVEALRARGTRLLLYEWAIAFYPSIATPWQRALPASALLNQRPLRGHLGAFDADAFYYDPVSRQHEQERARVLGARLRDAGYDGVFFDTTTSDSVHPAALAEFTRRHPTVTYNTAFARFLRALRRELKDGVIATNQGYRAAAHVLPFVDVDISESLITRPVGGKFVMRPWNDPRDEWNSVSFLMRNLIGPVQRDYPRVQFVHLNYADQLDQNIVARIVAIARIYDADAFVATAAITGRTVGDAYFIDLGNAQTRVESTARRTAYRFFARGLAAVNFGTAPLSVPNATRDSYENVVTGEITRAQRIVVAPGDVALFRRK